MCNKKSFIKKKLTLGLIFGAGIGLCVGILTSNIAIGLVIGAGAGLVFGTTIGTRFKKENEK